MRLFKFDNLALNVIEEYYFRIEINRKVILIYSLSMPKLALTFIYYKYEKKTCRRYLIRPHSLHYLIHYTNFEINLISKF